LIAVFQGLAYRKQDKIPDTSRSPAPTHVP
jgi:hypothetical protein